jgi:hypothetical protein
MCPHTTTFRSRSQKGKKSRVAPAPIYVQLKAAYTISFRPHTLVPSGLIHYYRKAAFTSS